MHAGSQRSVLLMIHVFVIAKLYMVNSYVYTLYVYVFEISTHC